MAWVRTTGSATETIKEMKIGNAWATYNGLTEKTSTGTHISTIQDFTVGHSGKMYLDVAFGNATNDPKNVTFKHNNTILVNNLTLNAKGIWCYHFELDVQSGDRFTSTSSADPYITNGGIFSVSYRIV